ncbi:MAG: DNA gyrase C-terminal beta-propeller domain-containing protein, partial [Gammaproteobacteria bacterium]
EAEDIYFLASDAGYGFMAKLEDLSVKTKNGKSILSVPKGAGVLVPACVYDADADFIAAVSNTGRLLVMGIQEFPQLGKGKGIKFIQIPPAKLKTREEYVAALTVFSEGDSLRFTAGKRPLTLKPADIDHYYGERGRRGNVLPQGYRKVSRLLTIRAGEA